MPMKKPDSGAAMMKLMMGVLPLQLTDLDVSITDQKLVNLIVEPQALSSGQTVDAYRKQLVDMVTASSAFLTDAGVDPAIATELTAGVSGFLAGPGTFHIVLKPKAPLGVMSAMMTPMNANCEPPVNISRESTIACCTVSPPVTAIAPKETPYAATARPTMPAPTTVTPVSLMVVCLASRSEG